MNKGSINLGKLSGSREKPLFPGLSHEETRERIEADIAEYLAKGNKITVVESEEFDYSDHSPAYSQNP